ncbi:MAG TPA: AMP-binding protein [Solirubrobacteraceae bacterium]|nr:AMP-binding protein [Solirubrobacteraceae bacterium]
MKRTDVESLPELVALRAGEHPERVFLQDIEGRELTWGELHELSLRWAAAFASLGVGAGDRVVTMRRNSTESVAIFIGLGWLHAVEVPISTELRGNTLRHAIAVADGEVMVLEAAYLPRVAAIAEQLAGRLSLILDGDAEADVPFPVASQSELLASVAPSSSMQPPRAHEVACVVFTSGTTGPSKGVVLPWANLRASGIGNFPVADLTEEDCFYGPSSPSHVGAKTMPFLFAMLDGRIVVRDVFSTTRFWEEIADFGATTAILVGSMGHFLLSQEPRPEDSQTPLRNVCMCPVMPEHEEFNRRFGTRIFTVFNMTETSCPVVSDPPWEIADWRSCGRLRDGFPGYELRVVDECDEEVPDGSHGELMMRASVPWTMNLGYLGMAEKTNEAWRNGWFHTGDMFTRDSEGNYFFVDRVKDAIRRSGENVSSFELEAEVGAHPGVAECAAIAVPAEYAEDEIEIVVVRERDSQVTAAELIEFLVPRVPRYMVPRYVRFMEELPKNVRQRVQKELLRSERDPSSSWDRVAAGIELRRE